jgi:hypothetical protein
MGLYQQWQTANQQQFLATVKMGLIRQAATVLQEDPTTANHTERVTLASRILSGDNLDLLVQQAAYILAASGAVIDTADDQLLSMIGGLTDAFAMMPVL